MLRERGKKSGIRSEFVHRVYIQPGGFYPDMISCLSAAAKPRAVSQGAIRHRRPVSQAELERGTMCFFFLTFFYLERTGIRMKRWLFFFLLPCAIFFFFQQK